MVPESLQVSGVPECGLFMDMQTHTGEDKWTSRWKHIAQMQNVSSIYNQKCVENHRGDPSLCFLPRYNLGYIKTRYFIINSVYDEWYMRNILDLPESCFSSQDQIDDCNSDHRGAADA